MSGIPQPPRAPTLTILNNFHESFDARVWAEAFVRIVREKPEIATDEGTMIGWFANALMRGYDFHASKVAASMPAPTGEERKSVAPNPTPEDITQLGKWYRWAVKNTPENVIEPDVMFRILGAADPALAAPATPPRPVAVEAATREQFEAARLGFIKNHMQGTVDYFVAERRIRALDALLALYCPPAPGAPK